MKVYRSPLIATAIAATFLLAFGIPSLAAGPGTRNHRMHESLTVQIGTTATGAILGSVTNSYNHKTCTKPSCTYSVPENTRVTLTETARYSSWSFTEWILNGYKWSSTRTAVFKMPAYRVLARAAYSQQSNVYSKLVGQWLGPALGDAGQCGAAYGEWTFFRNREFSYTANYDDCPGVTQAGTYSVQERTIILHVTQGCTEGGCPYTETAYFRFLTTNAFEICDYPSDLNCNDYQRQ